MSDTRGPLEVAYDESIAPLMKQIIATCKGAGISVHAAFELDDDLNCTTHVLAPDVSDEFRDRYEPVARAATQPSQFFAYTITTRPVLPPHHRQDGE